MSIPGIGSSFPTRLRFAMDRAKVNQTELGKAIKAPQQIVSTWVDEDGSFPAGKYMVKLPTALKISGHYLLTGELPVEPPGADAMTAYLGVLRTISAAARSGIGKAVDVVFTDLATAAEAKGSPPGPSGQEKKGRGGGGG